jgi:hypothetical protein
VRRTRLVLWRHPKMGLVADLPDGTREWHVTPDRALEIVRAWAKEQGHGAG